MKTTKMKALAAVLVMSVAVVGAVPGSWQAADPFAITVEAAAKPVLNKQKMTLAVGQRTRLQLKNNKQTVKWSSGNKKVATVSSSGVVQGKKSGSTTITATAGKKEIFLQGDCEGGKGKKDSIK